MKKVKILIVEDEPVIADDLSFCLTELSYEVTGVAATAEKASAMLADNLPDIVLLDIQLASDQTGLDLAAEIKKQHDIPFVFLTSHSDPTTIQKVLQTNPSGYLVKPFNENDLRTTLLLALHNYAQDGTTKSTEEFVFKQHFFVKVKNTLVKVDLTNIIMVEAADNYAYIHTDDNKYLVSSTLKSIENKLPEQFLRTHRSFLVNTDLITEITEDYVIMGDKQALIGRTHRQDLKNRINLL